MSRPSRAPAPRRVDDRAAPAGPPTVHSLLEPSCCLLDVAADSPELLLSHMVEALVAQSAIRDAGMVLSLLLEREKLGSTAIGNGVAIPHARSLTVAGLRVALATSRSGLSWKAQDDEPVRLIFLILAPAIERARKPYLELIAQIADRMRLARARKRLIEARSFDEVAAALEIRE